MVINQKIANRWVARFTPLILIGIVCYTAFVVVGPVSVNYLLNPPSSSDSPRQGAAIAILIICFLLLCLITTTFFRILDAVIRNPGFVERGPRFYGKQNTKSTSRGSGSYQKRSKGHAAREEGSDEWEKGDGRVDNFSYSGGLVGGQLGSEIESPGLQQFYKRDIFVCEGDGRPRFCSTCLNWKPDRAHHCREVERCVRKMDHFCPWVGGIVSESNFKWFVQLNSWTAVFCCFIAVILGVFIGEGESISVHWIVTIAMAGLFGLFALGMSITALQFVFLNSTLVENLSSKVKVWTLAVYIPRPQDLSVPKPFKTVVYPSTASPNGVVSSGPSRTFAILHTRPGENPFDLGYYENFKSVMGNTALDWFIPMRQSPCADHSSQESEFVFGPVVQRLREEAGIASPSPDSEKHRRRQHKKSQQSSRGDTSHGQPDRSEVPNNQIVPSSQNGARRGNEIGAGDDILPARQFISGDGPVLPNKHTPKDKPKPSVLATLVNGHVPGDAGTHGDDVSLRDDVHR